LTRRRRLSSEERSTGVVAFCWDAVVMGVKEERRRWAEASRRGDGAAEVDGAAEERGRHGCCRERPAGANRGIRRRASSQALCRRIASNSSCGSKDN
jgi:hypothetical protein